VLPAVRSGEKILICVIRNVFYDLEKTWIFGVPNRIRRDAGTEICKIYKTGTVPIKSVRIGSLLILCYSPVALLESDNYRCSKSHTTHGLLGICVSWTPHFNVTSTIPGLKPPRLLFMGVSQGYCGLKSSTHTARASGQHSAHCGQDINWHIAKRVL
jgi:hypothetical protein